MSKRPLEFAVQWLQKAKNDLLTVDLLMENERGPADIIAFHCQQAIEKALKGFLTAQSIKFQRTHDLMELASLAEPYLPDLSKWHKALEQISHFAVDVRYPEAMDEPSRADVVQTREEAWSVYRMVESTLGTCAGNSSLD
ncbi:MAG: HEPN domain-containing protein [Chitinivibrionales bacterium]|nr:HEPN domain-containing protein [Chitinivibrionales bacterium]